MIKSKLRLLIATKADKERRSLTYRTISKETGVATSTLSKLLNSQMTRFDAETLEALCRYFDCEIGDILVYEPEASTKDR